MKSLILTMILVLGGGFLFAADDTITVGSASVQRGNKVQIPITWTRGVNDISALQFDIALPSGVSVSSISPSNVETTAAKTLSSAMVANAERVIVWGYNQTALPTGTIAVLTLATSSAMIPGTYTLTIKNLVASSPDGQAITITGTNGALTVTKTRRK